MNKKELELLEEWKEEMEIIWEVEKEIENLLYDVYQGKSKIRSIEDDRWYYAA